MRLCRYMHRGVVEVGILQRDSVRTCAGLDITGPLRESGEILAPGDVKLLAPVMPGKIIGVGRNYVEHARELGNIPPETEPLIFLKPPTSVLGPGETILIPAISRRVDFEGELGVVIGRHARNIPDDADPLDYVLGYTCINDVTARDLQKKDVQFTRAKGFDTFCPLGPWVETELDPLAVDIATRVNGEIRQRGNTRDMIFPVRALIRFLAGIMTLLPGDVIATGTPAGVGPLAPGDVVEVEVSGIGTLRNPVS